MKNARSLGNFDFRTLQVFVTTAEQGGMTSGAQVLGMTQSGVSQTIATLEAAIGKQLFDRTVRPIVLTGAGQALLERGKQIIADVQQAYLEASEGDQAKLARLSITMPESLANLLGPRLHHRLHDLARSWRISNGLVADQHSRFSSHAADVMITEDSHVAAMIDVDRHMIVSEPYVLIFPKDFPLEMELGPHLAASRFIRFSLRSSVGRKTEAQLGRLQIRPAEQIEFDSVVGHAQAVALGDGWGITTPLCLAQTPAVFDELEVRPIRRGSFSRRMTLVARQNVLGTATRTLAQECRAILSEEIFPTLFGKLPWLEQHVMLGDD